MIERFTNPQRAVAYLCSALHESLRGAKVDVTILPLGSRPPYCRTTDGQALHSVLETLTESYDQAAAVLGLEIDGYPIGAIQCRCEKSHRRVCSGHCRHHEDRPIVCVIVYPADHPPLDEQRKRAVAALKEENRRARETGAFHVARFYRG